ncbi:MFS transporter [Noviherbaspirillum sp. 17J57-3]|uniref:MFS transporter n=2 Tax=Noviherbaspirillum galbum TaxID=2709383 RepID=A0A6B3SUN8_9BURK|nr:MFS transporter [Noviherbaspirillum galbum]
MYFITYVDRVNVSTAAADFGKEFGLSKTQLGFVFSAFAYPYLVFQIIGGWLGDKYGPRKTLTVCAIIWAGSTILTGLVGGFASLIVARMLLGLGEGATFPTATRAMANWTSPDKRGFAQGITHAFARVGNAVTPPLVVALIASTSWRGSFVVLGCVSLVWVAWWAWAFRDNPADHPNITKEELAKLPEYGHFKDRPKVPWMPLFKRMMPVTITYFCYGWILWLFLSWIPQYFLHSYNLDLKKSAIFSAGVFFAGVIGDALGGIVSDHLLKKTGSLNTARRNLVVICMLLTLASLVPLMFVHDLVISAICLSLGFFFIEFTIGPMWSIPMDIAPKFSGTASGMMNTGSALAAILSPVVGGLLIDKTGNWELPFIVSMALMVLGSIVAFAMRPDKKFDETLHAPLQPRPASA